MVLRDVSEPSANEAVSILTASCMCITGDIVFVVIDREVVIDFVVLTDIRIHVLRMLTNTEPNSSVGATDKRQDGELV